MASNRTPTGQSIRQVATNNMVVSSTSSKSSNLVSSSNDGDFEKDSNGDKRQASSMTKNFSKNSNEYWPQIVNNLKQNGKIVLYTNLIGTTAKEINDMTVGIEFPNGMTSFGKTVLEKQENIREISNLVSMACGKEMQIKYLTDVQAKPQLTNEENLQKFAKESDIPFNII